jgi:glutamine amidotransferase
MCRLFGFRSRMPSQVHRSLLAAENALAVQSNDNPDGWGIAFFAEGSPHVTRSPMTAIGDALFHRLSGAVQSETVLAHVRRATRGSKTVFNCHPFQYGRWVFAHNGDVRDFDQHRATLLDLVSPRLRRFVLGETDSEVLFFMFLTQLSKLCPLSFRANLNQAMRALRATVLDVRAVCDEPASSASSLLTVMASDGENLLAMQGGKSLFFSTHKSRCSERSQCWGFQRSCEAPTEDDAVTHFVISSEPLHGENVWFELMPGEMVGIDAQMRARRPSRLRQQTIAASVLPVP